MTTGVPLRERCHGRWRELIPALGGPMGLLDGKHHPCPFCGGVDRFRFTDHNKNGGWICNQCGSGDGFRLLMKLKGIEFRDVADQIERVIGSLPAPKADRRQLDDKDLRRLRRELWKASVPAGPSDPVDQYLRSRGLTIPEEVWSSGALRYGADVRYDRGERYPCMIALVKDANGGAVQLHRTYLSRMTIGKAEVENPRRMMPGKLPHGSVVQLMAPTDTLVLAEGIETALAASQIFKAPAWSCIDAAHLMSAQPPAGVRRVIVAGDNDRSYAGQTAAYALAQRLVTLKRLEVEVRIPDGIGWDWLDVLNKMR